MVKRMLYSVFWFCRMFETWREAIAYFDGISIAIVIWIIIGKWLSVATWAMFLGIGYLTGFLARLIPCDPSIKEDVESNAILIAFLMGYSIAILALFVAWILKLG